MKKYKYKKIQDYPELSIEVNEKQYTNFKLYHLHGIFSIRFRGKNSGFNIIFTESEKLFIIDYFIKYENNERQTLGILHNWKEPIDENRAFCKKIVEEIINRTNKLRLIALYKEIKPRYMPGRG
jgi:hypothetical protein